MIAVHCDLPDCNTWAAEVNAAKFGFVTVTADETASHYCCLWHAAKHLATISEPPEEVDLNADFPGRHDPL